MKNIKYIILVLAAAFTAGSCNKFDELNTNPDVPTTVTPELLLTQLEKDTYRFWNPNATDFGSGNLWAKHTVLLETNPNPYQYYYSYSPYGSFGGMQKLTNLKRMVEMATGNPTENSYKGIALYMKAVSGFNMMMEMGDVPYSEAGLAEEGNTRPKYDKSADVVVSVLKDLKDAEALFASTSTTFGGDFMYNGNPAKWRRLCNAMQLRILNAISKKITTEQKARFAEIVNANNLLTEADNYQLVYSENTNASYPFFNGENRRIVTAPSDLVVDYLKLTNDRRLFYFAEPAAQKISGGLLENDFEAYVGAPTQLAADQLALNRAAGKYSLMNKRYPQIRSGDPMFQFTYSEQCFIIAEAIEEGWVSGSAQTWYENGVKAILKHYMGLTTSAPASYLHGMPITQTYINGYFTGEAAYKTGGTKADRIKQIITQRWLLDFFQGNGLFSYKTFLRTGYPEFPLDPATSMNPEDRNVAPKRWMYPTSELTTNAENYNAAVQSQYGGFDGINKVPWWLQ